MFRIKLLLLCAVLVLVGCGQAETPNNEKHREEVRILFATDLHYFAPSLGNDSPLFYRVVESGDGKLVHYSPEIVSALVAHTLEESPDALVLGGDLSFNGERESHLELAQALAPVYHAGIPVLVIPGNHDINRQNAYGFDGERAYTAAPVTPGEFHELYAPLRGDAVSADKHSLSYVYPLSPDTWIIMLDSCIYDKGYGEDNGRIHEKTLSWLEGVLQEVQKGDITAITVSHHNLMTHNALFFSGFTVADNQRVVDLLEQYGVQINLSGHMHIQHIARPQEEDGLHDIATNSLAVSPNLVGALSIVPGERIQYTAHSLDVAGWAEAGGLTDPNLLEFPAYSASFFSAIARRQVDGTLEDYNLTGEQRQEMAAFAQELNRHYFAGTIPLASPGLVDREAHHLWREICPREFFTVYMESILSEEPMLHTELTIELSVQS